MRKLVIKILSAAVVLLGVAMDFYLGVFNLSNLSVDILSGIFIALFYPLSYEDVRPSMLFACVSAALACAVHILGGIFSIKLPLMVSLSVIGPLVYLLFKSRNKFFSVRALFRLDSVWCSVEDYAYIFYLCVFNLLAMLLVSFDALKPAWPFYALLLCLMLVFYGFIIVRVKTGKTLFISKNKEVQIKDIIASNMVGVLNDEGSNEFDMGAVYTRIQDAMEKQRIFLDDKLTVDDLSEAVGTNKCYVSKAINIYSGKNFRQFVNYYRVLYSVELMKRDKRLTISEIAVMSGFHSVVTYNMAFKVYMNSTPYAYALEIRAKDRTKNKLPGHGAAAVAPIPVLREDKKR